MGVTSFQQSLYEFFDSGLLFRIALLQKTILFLLFLGGPGVPCAGQPRSPGQFVR